MKDLEAKITREAADCLDHLQGHVRSAKNSIIGELEMKEFDFEFAALERTLTSMLDTLKSRLYDHHTQPETSRHG